MRNPSPRKLYRTFSWKRNVRKGTSPPNVVDVQDRIVGNLKALERAGTRSDGSIYWLWICVCGGTRVATSRLVLKAQHDFERGLRPTPPSCTKCTVRLRTKSKIDLEGVEEIRRLAAQGESRASIARKFGISEAHAGRIASGKARSK